jgi:hypothetical protein
VPVSVIIAACCLVSVWCILALGETSRTDLTAEKDSLATP